jgi:hypothetical protein
VWSVTVPDGGWTVGCIALNVVLVGRSSLDGCVDRYIIPIIGHIWFVRGRKIMMKVIVALWGGTTRDNTESVVRLARTVGGSISAALKYPRVLLERTVPCCWVNEALNPKGCGICQPDIWSG